MICVSPQAAEPVHCWGEDAVLIHCGARFAPASFQNVDNFLLPPLTPQFSSQASISPALPGAPALMQNADLLSRFLPSSPHLPALTAPCSKHPCHSACPGAMASPQPQVLLLSSAHHGLSAPQCPSCVQRPSLHLSQAIKDRL